MEFWNFQELLRIRMCLISAVFPLTVSYPRERKVKGRKRQTSATGVHRECECMPLLSSVQAHPCSFFQFFGFFFFFLNSATLSYVNLTQASFI